MKVIKIKYKGQELECFVDKNVYLALKDYSWIYRCGYASRNRKKVDEKGPHWIHLHRVVLELNGITVGKELVVDHINRNKLDNRLKNLRVVSKSVNALNVSDETKELRAAGIAKATLAASKLPRTEKQLQYSRIAALYMNSKQMNVNRGRDSGRSKEVMDSVTGKVYSCIREAAEELKLNYSTLKSKLNGTNPNDTTLIFHNKD